MVKKSSHTPTWWQVFVSAIGGLIGVQSSEVRERDFTEGRWWTYVVMGIVLVVVFIVILLFIVKLILMNAGL